MPFFWLPGVIILIIGLLGWKYPRLINIFSKEDKEKMDLAALGKLFRNIFITTGVIFIVTAYFLQKADMPTYVRNSFSLFFPDCNICFCSKS